MPTDPLPTAPSLNPSDASNLLPDPSPSQPETPAPTFAFSNWVQDLLPQIGMMRLEIEAELPLVPSAILAALPTCVIQPLSEGHLPSSGFGLGGAIGSGKTLALAALLKASLINRLRIANSPTPPPTIRTMLWVSWPHEANWMRFNAGNPELSSRVDRLSSVPLLVLDDLGRERIKGTYSEDWSGCLLDDVVCQRHRARLPILWTTNVPLKPLMDLYGASFVGCLTENNPLIWIDGLTDLRRA